MKTTKLTTKLIGKTITVVNVKDERGQPIENGRTITGVYEGRDMQSRPHVVKIEGYHISTRTWEVVA